MPRTLLLLSLLLALPLAACVSKEERKAQRILDRAKRFEKARQFEQALELYAAIQRKYPGTNVAKQVKQSVDFGTIQDALNIDKLKNVNEVKEHLKAIAKAVETYYFQKERYPASLDELVPSFIPALPRDPWGARYAYGLIDRKNDIVEGPSAPVVGYVIAWFGKDRIPGGEGDDQDVFIQSGQFAQF